MMLLPEEGGMGSPGLRRPMPQKRNPAAGIPPVPQPRNPAAGVSGIMPVAGKVQSIPAPQAPVTPIAPPAPPVSAMAPPPSSAPPGMPTSSFGPGNDLLSTQINPSNNRVNRTELAQNSIKDWDAQNAPRLAAQQREIGQNAAKFGRIGAGMTTNDLTGSEATYNRDRMSFQNALASGLADDTVNDGRADNNELRTERGYQTGRSDKAQQDSIDQRVLEEDLLNSRFDRDVTRTRTGYGDSPVDTLGNFSDQLGQQGSDSIASGVDLLRSKPQYPSTFGGMIPGTPDANGIPQVTQGGRPVQIQDRIIGADQRNPPRRPTSPWEMS